jgi:formate dehydrogenase maturation protein FdhE
MSPLNAAGEAIQKLIEVRDLAKFGDTLRKMHSEVMAATQGVLAAYAREMTHLDQIRDLEEEVRNFDTWNTEKDRYELKQLAHHGPSFAYALKSNAKPAEKFHCICASCYQRRIKSVLQFDRRAGVRSSEQILKCPVCGSEAHSDSWPPPNI